MQKDTLNGAGPWQFDIPALASDASHTFNFRNKERNGQKGFYRPYLPLDSMQISNQSGQPLAIDINQKYSDIVVPNAVETYRDVGITVLKVTNDGSSATSAGDITATVKSEPYNDDDRARELASQGPVRRVISKFTGL